MNLRISFLILILFSLTASSQTEPLKLWYDKPAEKWTEALPIGNGRQGAMIFGNPLNEHFYEDKIRLLPALPTDWLTGKISGFKARGNIKVSIKWEDERLTNVTLITQKDKAVLVDYNGITI